MAVTSIMTTEVEINAKAGANASAGYTEAMKDAAVLRAESLVNDMTRNNYSDSYATLNVDKRYLLSDVVSSFVAIQWIKYDMSVYTTRIEAEDMMNVERDTLLRGLSLLRDQEVVSFINAA